MLGGRWGRVGAYALFGVLRAHDDRRIELTTPDLLNAAAAFVAFGALLRLRDDHRATRRAHAVVLGVALGVGALAKSFMVPWAVVCFATLARRDCVRAAFEPLVIAVVVWLVIRRVRGPSLLSHAAGRFTFGDTGRLTYAWYVNNQDAPSLGGVPPGARTARTEAILPGVGRHGRHAGTPIRCGPIRRAGTRR